MNAEFLAALREGDKKRIRRVPKTDFHNHSIFGTRLKSVEKWIGLSLPKPPARMKSLQALKEYAEQILYPHIYSRDGFEFTADSALQDAIYDGVVVLGMSLDSKFINMFPDGEIGFISFLSRLKRKYQQKINFCPELGISRDRNFREIEGVLIRCIESNFFYALDLYGHEKAQAPETYKFLYKKARQKGMKLKAHVGEFGDAESIRKTVEVLGLDEVQHGISAATSVEVMNWLKENDIKLNVCPTSNIALGRVPSFELHPLRKLFDAGLFVTINTDDLMIFNQSVSEEYLNLFRAGVFTGEELDHIRARALEAA